MHIHIIACQVFYREISYLAALTPHTTTVTWLPQGLHDTPNDLRQRVKDEIDKLEDDIANDMLKHNPDCILLGYGLCSNGTVGIRSKTLPIIVPRTDDCIGVFLGSQKRYLELFRKYPGVYWLNNGWLESAMIPTQETYDKMRETYVQYYGEENADFLMEHETGWIKNYHYCGYISSQVFDVPEFREKARRMSEYNSWEFLEFKGELSFLKRLLDGDFREEEVLICRPGYEIEASYGEEKLIAKPVKKESEQQNKL